MKWLQIVQIIISVALMISILLQSRGTGVSGLFGGGGNVYRTKRGIEKTLFIATIILTVLFFLTAFLNLILQN